MPRLGVDLHADASDLLQVAVSFASSGSNPVIAGVAGQVIRVWKIFFLVGGATAVTFLDGSTGLSGAIPFAANAGMVLDFDTKPWITCSSGNAFNINNSNAVQVSGTVYYTQVWMSSFQGGGGGAGGGSGLPYQLIAPISGDTVLVAAKLLSNIINPATTLATLTINLPTGPDDGDVTRISVTQAVNFVTFATTDGSAIVSPPTTLWTGQALQFIYVLGTNTWYIN